MASSDGTVTSTNISPFPFSVAQSRRTTCDMCRERKVRCDRGKPECGRCKKTLKGGQKCTYPSTGGEAAKFNSALRSLHARLAQAESMLQERGVLFSKDTELGSLSEFSNLSRGLSNDIDLGDVPLDFGSWEDATTDFDSMDGFFDGPSLPELKTDSPSTRMTAPYCPSPEILLNVGQISEETMQSLFQAYYDLVQKHLQLIGQMEPLQSTLSVNTHQGQALRYAVGMAGANTCENSQHLQQQCYVAARFHLEMAETQTDSSSLLSLETVQALILVARFEFTHAREATALITTARLSRLLSLLGYDKLGGYDARTDKDGVLSPVRLEEMKRTFWIAFLIKCHASTRCPGWEPIAIDEKASFLGPIIGESEKIGISAANSMCDVLLQADVLSASQAPIYKEMSLFIMPPLALAANIQLRVLENWKKSTGLNNHNTSREIRLSLKTIYSAMNAFKDSTSQYEPHITKCREFLDSIQFGEPFTPEFVCLESTSYYGLMPSQMNIRPGGKTPINLAYSQQRPENYTSVMVGLNHPLSRGSVHIGSSGPMASPTIDPGYLSHPLDMEILVPGTQFIENIINQQEIKRLLKGGRLPSLACNLADIEIAKQVTKERLWTTYHPSCTCAMMPKDLGGVVNDRLVVHGNIQATVYAVAERASDLIKEDWARCSS
ncbi:conserved hypothetical protein [Microsporum canis CBS 113480]|uniref:Zn(2)-C6 fungal-type domain-containing protein n=1 Tax=Arthroderma otae (strain ATCC MYA-4605 / CBS 113480) TaxID=554155 RepID=C5FVX7_ARTOC|nr:conserved hypothetical protein [Microsporum canis CBS 113480]EEQ34061.1 conserved hypothetical protein [Microsporum canis CBS 113480]